MRKTVPSLRDFAVGLVRRKRLVESLFAVLSGQVWGTFLFFALFLLYQTSLLSFRRTLVLGILILGAGLAGLVFFLARPPSKKEMKRALAEADRKSGDKELLLTAFGLTEEAERNKSSDGPGQSFRELVLAEAAERASKLDTASLFPVRYPSFVVLRGLAFVTSLVLFFLPFRFVQQEALPLYADFYLDQKAKELREDALRQDLPNTLLLSLDMEELAGALRDESLPEQDRRERSQGLIDRLDEQILGLERQNLPPMKRLKEDQSREEGQGYDGRGDFGGQGLAQRGKARMQLRALGRKDLADQGEDYSDKGDAKQSSEEPGSEEDGTPSGKKGSGETQEMRESSSDEDALAEEELLRQLEKLLAETSQEDLKRLKESRKFLKDTLGEMSEDDYEEENEGSSKDSGLAGTGPGEDGSGPNRSGSSEQKAGEKDGAGNPEEAEAGGPALALSGNVLSDQAARFALRDRAKAGSAETADGPSGSTFERRAEAAQRRDEIPRNLQTLVEDYLKVLANQ